MQKTVKDRNALQQLLSQPPKIARTSCCDCVFAIWNGNTQTDCELSRLNKLDENGAIIIDACNHDREFYVIEDRYCNAMRPITWHADCSIEDKTRKLYNEICIRPDIIIYADSKSSTLDIIYSFESIFNINTHPILNEKIIPQTIYIVLDNCKIDDIYIQQQLAALQQKQCSILPQYLDLPRYITRVFECENDLGCAIDVIFNKLKSNYYTVIPAGNILNTEYLNKLDQTINIDMKRLMVDRAGPITTIANGLHKQKLSLASEITAYEYIMQKYPKGLIL